MNTTNFLHNPLKFKSQLKTSSMFITITNSKFLLKKKKEEETAEFYSKYSRISKYSHDKFFRAMLVSQFVPQLINVTSYGW